MAIGLFARKVGMSRLLAEDGRFVPVTVLEAGPCQVVAVRTQARDGYSAVQLGYQAARRGKVSKGLAGHFAANRATPTKVLGEFRLAADPEVAPGQEVRVDIFKEGEMVDVSGVSKWKGFAGTVKLYHFGRGPMTHGSKCHRRPASAGATDAQRVFPGKRSPGHMGNTRHCERNLLVVRVDAERGLLFLRGAVPGARGGLLEVRPARSAHVKRHHATAAPH